MRKIVQGSFWYLSGPVVGWRKLFWVALTLYITTALFFLLLISSVHASSINSTNTDGLIAYGELNVQTPRYRIWNSSANNYSIEQTNTNSVSGDILWVVTRANHERDEMIVGTQDTNADVNIQIINGSRNWTNLFEVSSDVPSTLTRSFDIAYEDISGDALIVYENSAVLTDNVVGFRTWNGTAYSDESNYTTTLANSPFRFVSLFPKAGTDEIMLLVHNNAGDLHAVLWNGTDFNTSTRFNLSLATSSNVDQHFDFAWEAESGDGLAVYGEGTTLVRRNYTASSATWSVAESEGFGNAIANARLCADLNSNYIGLILQDGGSDVNVRVWNGSLLLSGSPTEDATAEPAGTNNVNTDCAWASGGSVDALFAFVDLSALNITYVTFTKTNESWSHTSLETAAELTSFASDDIDGLRFSEHPTTNETMVIAMDILEDITAIRWNGTGFETISASPVEQSTEVLTAAQEEVMFAWDFFDPVPAIVNLTVNVSALQNRNEAINISVNVTDNLAVDAVLVNITKPLGTVVQARLTNVGTLFNLTFNNTDEVGTYTVRVIANDTSRHKNSNSTQTITFQVNDIQKPSVAQIIPVADSVFNLSNTINISVNVTDETGVSTVLVNISFPNGTKQQVTLTNTSNTIPSRFNFTFTNTLALGTYNLTFIANDSSNNLNDTEKTNFTIRDIFAPNVTSVRPLASSAQRNGTITNISATVTDDGTIDRVLVNITYPDNTTKEQLILQRVANIFNFSFGNTSQSGTYNITFIANDTGGNSNATEKTNVTVDVGNPIVNNIHPRANNFTALNSIVNISANVTNGVGVDVVLANVTYPDNTTKEQLTLAKVVDIYNFSFGNTSTQGHYNITFIANDTVNNINATEKTNFTVDSTGPSVTIQSPTSDSTTTGSLLVLNATVADEFLPVDSVLVNITYPDNTTREERALTGSGDTYNATFSNTTTTGSYVFVFIANDTARNKNNTEQRTVIVTAPSAPAPEEGAVSETVAVGGGAGGASGGGEGGLSQQIPEGRAREPSPAPEGEIAVETPSLRKPLPVSTLTEALFDVQLILDETEIISGEMLFVKISLINFGSPGKIDVTLFYTITDEKGSSVLEQQEIHSVETQTEFLKTFAVPESLSEGTYTLAVKIMYEGKEAISDATFEVKKEKDWSAIFIIVSVIVAIGLFYILSLWVSHNYAAILQYSIILNQKIHSLSENLYMFDYKIIETKISVMTRTEEWKLGIKEGAIRTCLLLSVKYKLFEKIVERKENIS